MRVALHAAALLAVPAVFAALLHQPLLFPSLGPTAYALARGEGSARAVLPGHALGVACGALSVALLGVGPLAAVLALTATIAGMEYAGLRHGPACATTLIVALGGLVGPSAWGWVVPAVAVQLAVDRLIRARSSL